MLEMLTMRQQPAATRALQPQRHDRKSYGGSTSRAYRGYRRLQVWECERESERMRESSGGKKRSVQRGHAGTIRLRKVYVRGKDKQGLLTTTKPYTKISIVSNLLHNISRCFCALFHVVVCLDASECLRNLIVYLRLILLNFV